MEKQRIVPKEMSMPQDLIVLMCNLYCGEDVNVKTE